MLLESTMKELLLFLPLIAAVYSSQSDFDHIIHVNQINGSNSEECLKSNKEDVACKDLDWALKYSQRLNSTKYVLAKDTYELIDGFPAFQNLYRQHFVGNNSTLVCQQLGIGFTFHDVKDIAFKDLKISNCSCAQSISSIGSQEAGQVESLSAAVNLLMCKNVLIENTDIMASPNARAIVMYNVMGSNAITHSKFGGSGYQCHNASGGITIEFNYCMPHGADCSGSVTHTTAKAINSGGYFLFENVTFINNSDTIRSTSSCKNGGDHILDDKLYKSFGNGGGLALTFKRNAAHNHFSFTNCVFSNNIAHNGGGLFVSFLDSSSNNTVYIQKSTFLHNTVDQPQSPGMGGGLRVEHKIYSDKSSNFTRNSLVVADCNFNSNKAFSGGGISLLLSRMKSTRREHLFHVNIKNSYFHKNTATIGSAIEGSVLPQIIDGKTSVLHIESTHFTENTIFSNKTLGIYEEGTGSLYADSVPISFIGDNYFNGNDGSAVSVVGTKVDVTDSNISFINNTGRYGGGIRILGTSFILVDDNTSLSFIGNFARIHGGAISNVFIEQDNYESNSNCFIRHVDVYRAPDDWNVKVVFINNSASSTGHSIYTTSVLPCSNIGGEMAINVSDIFRWNGWTYIRSITTPLHEIASSVGIITYNDRINDDIHNLAIASIPGKEIRFPFTVTDEFANKKTSPFTTFMLESHKNNSCRDLKFKYVTGQRGTRTCGAENSQLTVRMSTVSERAWQLKLNIYLGQCPPGYILSSSEYTSECTPLDPYTKLTQYGSNFKASFKSGYWMGKLENGKLKYSICPPSYCVYKNNHLLYHSLPSNYTALEETVCGELSNRKGILCGLCKKNYGVSVTTETLDCISCNDSEIIQNIAKYVLIQYLPLAVLFTLLLLFQVRLASGAASSYIFYAQTVSSILLSLTANGNIHYDTFLKGNQKIAIPNKFLFGIFNLRIGQGFIPPLCIHTKLNSLDVFQLDYLVALFPLIFMIAVVLAVKLKDSSAFRRSFRCFHFNLNSYWNIRRFNIRNSLLHVFSGYLILSYSRLTISSLSILNRDHNLLYKETCASTRVLFAGQYSPFDPKYTTRFMLPALAFTILLNFLLPLALLNYPVIWLEKCIHRIQWLSKLYPVDKVHIFLDTFQGFYKDNRRYFAGILFLFRTFLAGSYLLGRDSFHQYLIQQFIFLLLVIVYGVLWPYRKEFWYLNIVDLLIFTNLSIINGLGLVLLSFNVIYTNNHSIFLRILCTQQILLYLPLVYIIIIVIPKSIRTAIKSSFWKLTIKGKELFSRPWQRSLSLENITVDGSLEQENLSVSPNEVKQKTRYSSSSDNNLESADIQCSK